MKKRIFVLLFVIVFLFTGCGSSSGDQNTSSAKADSKDEKPTSPKRDFPEGDYADTGNGTFSIQTSGGDSSDGSIPVLFVSKDDILVQIGYRSEGMDGSHLSYIYIDGIEISKEQMADSQGSLDLQDDSLSAGTHTVEVVQYSNDKPDGELITYKSCQYEVKES